LKLEAALGIIIGGILILGTTAGGILGLGIIAGGVLVLGIIEIGIPGLGIIAGGVLVLGMNLIGVLIPGINPIDDLDLSFRAMKDTKANIGVK
jgi:hypothetical protein